MFEQSVGAFEVEVHFWYETIVDVEAGERCCCGDESRISSHEFY